MSQIRSQRSIYCLKPEIVKHCPVDSHLAEIPNHYNGFEIFTYEKSFILPHLHPPKTIIMLKINFRLFLVFTKLFGVFAAHSQKQSRRINCMVKTEKIPHCFGTAGKTKS